MTALDGLTVRETADAVRGGRVPVTPISSATPMRIRLLTNAASTPAR